MTSASDSLDLQNRIIAIFADQARVAQSEVGPASTAESLGLDSLGMVEAIFAIEEAFDVQVPVGTHAPDPLVSDGTTLAAITATVQGLLARKAA